MNTSLEYALRKNPELSDYYRALSEVSDLIAGMADTFSTKDGCVLSVTENGDTIQFDGVDGFSFKAKMPKDGGDYGGWVVPCVQFRATKGSSKAEVVFGVSFEKQHSTSYYTYHLYTNEDDVAFHYAEDTIRCLLNSMLYSVLKTPSHHAWRRQKIRQICEGFGIRIYSF